MQKFEDLVEKSNLDAEDKQEIKHELGDILKNQFEGLSYLTLDYAKKQILDISKTNYESLKQMLAGLQSNLVTISSLVDPKSFYQKDRLRILDKCIGNVKLVLENLSHKIKVIQETDLS